jgi:membrane dipeptidase
MSLSDKNSQEKTAAATEIQKVFDGHNDMLYQLWTRGDQKGQLFLSSEPSNPLSITHHKAQNGGLAGGLFAIFVPANKNVEGTRNLSQPEAFQYTLDMLAIADYLNDAHGHSFRICRNKSDIIKAEREGAIAAVLHIEGAEAIGADLTEIEQLSSRGIRSIGPLWSRPNIFGQGVPFTYPGSPDQGSGLTANGKALVKECDAAGIMLDVSHLNEAGFWDIAKISNQPIIASHSNAHSLCPSPRNLTDRQLDAIAERGGLVGVCFATAYLREDGARDRDTSLDLILRQFDYLISRVGEDNVAFGSDFDGAVLPASLSDAAALPTLITAMQAYGFGAPLIAKLCWDNWLNKLA